jgi:hypothetical protein
VEELKDESEAALTLLIELQAQVEPVWLFPGLNEAD